LNDKGQNQEGDATKRSSSLWRVVGIFTVLGTIAAGIAAFSGNIITSIQNVKTLFFPDTKITVGDAAGSIPNPLSSGEDDYFLPIKFSVVVEGGKSDTKPECSGELSSGGLSLSSTEGKNPKLFLEIGRQVEMLNVGVSRSSLNQRDLTVLNFRLDCGNLGKSPVTPVNLTVASVVTVAPEKSPTVAARPTQSFKVCMGNGGGPSCAGGANAYFTCDQYNAIGGGAKSTYDTLAKKFCEYQEGGKAILGPNKVIVNSSLGGDQCGWTTFTVVCNP
jgi:hypothetical protein